MDTNKLGIGAMIAFLGGNKETVEAVQASLNKTIKSAKLSEDKERFFLEFTDGKILEFRDGGQSCCESRYMSCDDKLEEFSGDMFLNAEILEAPSIKTSEYGDHDVEFLSIKTNRGVITISNHNEHNGYYGGFAIKARAY